MEDIDEAYSIFSREVYPDGGSVMCSIHDVFGGFEGGHHNCLGCNFADATSWIQNFLATAVENGSESRQEFFFDYLLKLYLLVERFYIVFEIIGLPLEYRCRHFSTFQHVHKWANFIKHPKSFLLVHHPQYFMENEKHPDVPFISSEFGVIIDQGFVDNYYSGPEKNSKLHQLLTNKKDIAVVFPNVVDVTTEFCSCIHKFIDVIRNNEVYREVLKSRTTYDNFFEEDGE